MVFVLWHLRRYALLYVMGLGLFLSVLLGYLVHTDTLREPAWLTKLWSTFNASILVDQTIALEGIQLSTKSNHYQYHLLSKPAKQVKTDLAAFDIFLSDQFFSFPDGTVLTGKDKPRELLISLTRDPQPYYILYDPSAQAELGSMTVHKEPEMVSLTIYLPSKQPSLESGSWQVTKLILYGLYGLTHGWTTDEATTISRLNEKFVNYYGQPEQAPTFYLEAYELAQ